MAVPTKIYCTRCRDFTYHRLRGNWQCQRCLGRGNPILFWAIMALPIIAFVIAVWRLSRGGSW